MLAPVVVDLAEFPALLHGSQAHTVSASMPWLDEAERNQGPYQIAMRGVILQPEALYGLAREQDGVFVARYEADGSFSLEYAGAVQPQMAETCGVALFDQTICLENIDLIPAENSLIIRSSWWTNAPPRPTSPFLRTWVSPARRRQPRRIATAGRGRCP
ncbi:MAG: hypothetical protein M5U34_49095 [Chloroflexi bacterium]|nr:hypothetical protein [Chloroflexota bacterium]